MAECKRRKRERSNRRRRKWWKKILWKRNISWRTISHLKCCIFFYAYLYLILCRRWFFGVGKRIYCDFKCVNSNLDGGVFVEKKLDTENETNNNIQIHNGETHHWNITPQKIKSGANIHTIFLQNGNLFRGWNVQRSIQGRYTTIYPLHWCDDNDLHIFTWLTFGCVLEFRSFFCFIHIIKIIFRQNYIEVNIPFFLFCIILPLFDDKYINICVFVCMRCVVRFAFVCL